MLGGRTLALFATPLAVVGGGSSVGAGVAAVVGGGGAIVSAVGAGVDRHLGLVLGECVAYHGVQIASGGVFVAAFGRPIALVGPAVVVVELVA